MREVSQPIECHCALLRQVSRKLTSIYDGVLEPAGLTLPQFSLLRRLHRYGPLTITALAETMGLERTTLGRNLRPLRRDKLIQTTVNENDTRERIVSLTGKGSKMLAAAAPLWKSAQSSVERRYGKAKIALLHQLMEEIDAASLD